VGPVSADPCDRFRGLIAMEVVGRISEEEGVALTAHTDGCAACRDDRRDLLVLPLVLPAADPDHVEEQELPFELRRAVLDRLRQDERHERRVRRSWVAVGSAAAAAVAAVTVLLTVVLPSGPAVRTLSLRGPAAVHATARLTSEPWGTALDLQETGQAPGQVLTVAMQSTSGAWWPTGTYRTRRGRVGVTMACAVTMAQISDIAVRNATGHVVLYGELDGGARGGPGR